MGSDTEVHIKRDGINALVVPEWAEHFDPDWFDPDYWGERVVPVSSGGRGSAWFVERTGQDWVLRHYRRGGLISRLSAEAYIYGGERQVRSLREFRMLQRMKEMRLPVPKPVAASYCRHGLFYQASIIIERLESVTPWGELLSGNVGAGDSWERVGQALRSFHVEGVYHADLNCFNVMMASNRVYLIDFDRGEFRPLPRTLGAGWHASNLSRLYRSLAKTLAGCKAEGELASGWERLREAYFR